MTSEDEDPLEAHFMARFKTSEELTEFCRPALEKAARMQDEVRAKARALREAKRAQNAEQQEPDPEP